MVSLCCRCRCGNRKLLSLPRLPRMVKSQRMRIWPKTTQSQSCWHTWQTATGTRVVEIAHAQFIDKGDIRDEIYVLLRRFLKALVGAAVPKDSTPTNRESQGTPGLTPPGSPGFDLRPPVEGTPRKQCVRQYINWFHDAAPRQPGGGSVSEFRIDASEGSALAPGCDASRISRSPLAPGFPNVFEETGR